MELVDIILYAGLLLFSSLLLRAVFTGKRRDHPSPPGPFALPFIGHLHILGPRVHQTLHKLSLRYGPLMELRLGCMPLVVVSNAEFAKEFLKTHELTFSSRRMSTVTDMVTYDSSFAFSSYNPYWKFIRKLLTSELLGARNIMHFQPIRTMEVTSFLELLMEKAKLRECFNLSEELLKLTNNVISNMMLSVRCTQADAEAARAVVRDVTQIFGEFDVSDVVWLCKNFDVTGIRRRSKEIHRRYDALLEKFISEREKERQSRGGGGEAKDLLDMFLDIMESGKSEVEFTREHLKALILDFFTAGTDTTATTTEWTIAELIKNPSLLKKAQEEIDKVVGRDRLLQESDGANLPYLQAIIKETLRLHPPIPIVSRRAIDDCVIGGYKIRNNSFLFVNVWSIGRNAEYWDSPLEYRPERFLKTENASVDVKGQHFQLLPFGSGRRGCPGVLLAIQELILIIGTMLQCFDWKLPDGSGPIDMTERPGLAAPRAAELVCQVLPRVNAAIIPRQ